MSTIDHIQQTLDTEKPLIICDVDEVVLAFVAPLEGYLSRRGARLTKDSFRLSGNVIDEKTGEALPITEASQMVASFHQEAVDQQPLVSGALMALEVLSADFQIIFLTNVAENLIERRRQHLFDLGLPHPVLQNDGSKADAVAQLSRGLRSPVVFIDDLPPHHMAVKAMTPAINCIHFMADNTFRALVSFENTNVQKADSWRDIQHFCRATLG